MICIDHKTICFSTENAYIFSSLEKDNEKNTRILTIIFSYIILSSTALIAIDFSNNNAFAANQTNNTIANTTNKTSLLKPGNFAVIW